MKGPAARSIFRKIFDRIGPGPRTRLIAALRRPRPDLGRGTYVHSTVHLIGARAVRVGAGTVISEACWLNVNHVVEGAYAIDIARNCFIGKRNFFSSGANIEFCPYVLTTVDCKFIGSSHRIEDPSIPYLASGTTHDATIRIGVNCFVGAGAVVMGNVSIGHGSVIGALAFVTTDVPPFSVVIGNPARIVKRYSYLTRRWLAADACSADVVAAMPNEADYLATLDRHPATAIPYPAAGRDMGNT